MTRPPALLAAFVRWLPAECEHERLSGSPALVIVVAGGFRRRGISLDRFSANVPIFANVFKLDRHSLGDTRFLHGYPVQGVGRRHRFLGMRDDDKLSPLQELV